MITLYAHPFSSYCQKALTALYENETPFTLALLDNEKAWVALEELWPLKRMPVLVDGSRKVIEATIIIEYLALNYPGRIELIPEDRLAALETRTMDRIFDNYIMTPMQKIVGDHLRPEDKRDARGVEDARTLLDRAYGWLDGVMANREWAAGNSFTVADCAAAPSLFYADWAHAIDAKYANACLSPAASCAALICARRRRGAALPAALSLGSAGPRLKVLRFRSRSVHHLRLPKRQIHTRELW